MAEMNQLLADAWVASVVDDAVAPFDDLLPPEELSWMRERLADLLEEDPEARAALAGARPRVVDDSGERVLQGVDATAVMNGAIGSDGGAGLSGPSGGERTG